MEEGKVVFSRGAHSGELQAAVSLSDALGLQLCGVNSHKTSLCSQKMRACKVRPCTYTCSTGNNTFIPYDALGSHLLMFLSTNRPRGVTVTQKYCTPSYRRRETNCQSAVVTGSTNLHLQIHKWHFECQIFICVECAVWHLHQRNVWCLAKSKKGNVHYWD